MSKYLEKEIAIIKSKFNDAVKEKVSKQRTLSGKAKEHTLNKKSFDDGHKTIAQFESRKQELENSEQAIKNEITALEQNIESLKQEHNDLVQLLKEGREFEQQVAKGLKQEQINPLEKAKPSKQEKRQHLNEVLGSHQQETDLEFLEGLKKGQEERKITKLTKIHEEFEIIDKALIELKTHIGKIENHENAEAYEAAKTLITRLENSCNHYFSELFEKTQTAQEAKKQFKESCINAMAEAYPKLEEDLGWGAYLTNLIKTLVNAISGGYSQTFFKPEESKSAQHVQNFKEAVFKSEQAEQSDENQENNNPSMSN